MENTTNSPPNNSSSHNLLITITVFTVTVTVFLILYLILRYRCNCLRRRSSPSSSTVFSSSSSGNRISPETETTSSSIVDSLPLFTFSSITRRSSSVVSLDCAVCLSKFEQTDLLRLLPLCCHAFHTECIDAWLRSNLTCPLCRSAVVVSESELMKIFRPSSASSGNSFRLEIGNVSNRRGDGTAASNNVSGETDRRLYSVGAFEYFVDEEAEIPFGHTNRRIVSGEKDDSPASEVPVVSQASLVGEGSWLKDYVDNLSNLVSFGGSGRFFTGSSRRNDVVGVDYEVQANHGFGEEITEMFRWISGV
ncbi:E3 ubiquitin-protein ligase ATL4-like [Trifolium pratense]|uniref:E3 ubiquitin-protein ligase ATL4-like n=1 Tax=Trifolium pratense TaxID=57577 RepID=UPI001E697698|nr:E3 ubiquitin-protein ligase ATL4-like [Trifolium pratense]